MFAGVAGVALISAIHLLSQPIPKLLGVVADDAFYYLKVAASLAANGTSSFDGINPTNGYHPLWMLATVICAKLTDGKETLIRCMLACGFLAHLLSVWILAKALRLFLSATWALIGAALWLASPFALRMLLQGVEAPLYWLALISLLYVYLKHIEPSLASAGPVTVPARHLVGLGMVLGFTFLARTEIVLSGLVWATMLCFAWCRRRTPLMVVTQRILIVSGTCALVVLPWLLYCYLTVGSLSQDSGTMKLLWGSAKHSMQSPAAYASEVASFVGSFWLSTSIGLQVFSRRSELLAGVVVLVLGLVISRYRKFSDPLRRTTLGIVSGLLLTGITYASSLDDCQLWHLIQPGFGVFFLLFSWATVVAENRAWKSRTLQAVFGFALLASAGIHARMAWQLPETYPWQRDVYQSQPKFELLVPEGELIGSFNAGIPGYFSQRTIVNLDGLVNHTAVDYWKARDFAGYLRAQGIHYIMDEQMALKRACSFSRSVPKLETLASVDLTDWPSGQRHLWKIVP